MAETSEKCQYSKASCPYPSRKAVECCYHPMRASIYETHGGGPCWQKDGKTINEILDGVMEKGGDHV